MCGKSLSNASADYHQDMNSDVFESWLEKQLLPNLPQKCVLIIDNASYHSRQEVKEPTQATRKAEISEFMMKKNITTPSPVPTRPVLNYKITSGKGYFIDTINPGGDDLYTADQICRMVEFLIDNIFVKFGGCLFRQVIGIPMGTNCAPLLADLFLYSYESEF